MPTGPGDAQKTTAFGARILELCIEAGGTITGEHGVGVEKIDEMCVQFAPLELERFHAVKRAFDPDGLLNPGQGGADRCTDAPRWAACTSTAANCPTRSYPDFEL